MAEALLHNNSGSEKDARADVLSLESSSEFSGFESEEIAPKRKKSVAIKKKKDKQESSKVPKNKVKSKKPLKKGKNQSTLVQIDLNNLTDGNIETLKSKLGLSNPQLMASVLPQSNEYYYSYNDWDEHVDINNVPNLHIEVENQNDGGSDDDDSIGLARQQTPRVKDLSKKLVSELFGDSEKENQESDSEWKLPKIKKKSKGVPVCKSLADLVNTACTSSCDTDSILEKHNIPENCERLFPPSVNLEIWKILDKKAKSYDRVFQDIQTALAAGIVPILKLVEMLKSHLSAKDEAKELISEALTMFGQVHHSLSIRRRYLLRPNINKKYRNLCSVGTPITGQLFGDDISKEMKNCDTGLSLGNNLVRDRFYPTMYGNPREFNRGRGRYPRNFNRGRGRFMPYTPYGAHFNARGYGAGGPFRGRGRPYRPTATVSVAPNGGN